MNSHLYRDRPSKLDTTYIPLTATGRNTPSALAFYRSYRSASRPRPHYVSFMLAYDCRFKKSYHPSFLCSRKVVRIIAASFMLYGRMIPYSARIFLFPQRHILFASVSMFAFCFRFRESY